jgi:hypothetical protein
VKTKNWVASKKQIQSLFVAAILGVLATGCATYSEQNKVVVYWRQGDLTNAVTEATTLATQNAKNKDAIIWRLEQGAVLRANGQYDDSNKAFDTAQDGIDKYAQEAKVKLGHEAGALLSNQAELPYEGRSYDGIMLNTYKALNYLALGEHDKARPELIRAYQRQQDAVEDNKKRIQKIQDEAASNTNSIAIQKAQQDPKFQDQIQGTNYASLNNLKPYADYVNPFTVYLDGLYFMANAADGSDLERARKSFERVSEFDPDNNYVKDDLAAVEDLIQGKPLVPATYVIFETGCAPERGQVRIDVPIILSKVSYVGAAFPTFNPQENYVPGLNVTANIPVASTNDSGANTNAILASTTVATSEIASMDSVIGLDFKNEMPIVITKTIASTVTKAVAAYAVNNAANQQSDIAGLFAQIGTAVYEAAVNIADERTWTTLPKEFQVCRIPTPPDRKVLLEMPDGAQKIPVTIGDGTINIIYVKSISPGTPLLVTQMKLK